MGTRQALGGTGPCDLFLSRLRSPTEIRNGISTRPGPHTSHLPLFFLLSVPCGNRQATRRVFHGPAFRQRTLVGRLETTSKPFWGSLGVVSYGTEIAHPAARSF